MNTLSKLALTLAGATCLAGVAMATPNPMINFIVPHGSIQLRNITIQPIFFMPLLLIMAAHPTVRLPVCLKMGQEY